MSNDCYCFGPPVPDCPTHGKKADAPRMATDVGTLMDRLRVDSGEMSDALRQLIELVAEADSESDRDAR